MQYKRFLFYSGLALIAAAMLGNFGLGPTANASALGKYLYFDVNQSIIHLLLGIIAVCASFLARETVNRYITTFIGVVFLVTSALSLYRAASPIPNLFALNIETPLESLVYLAFGLWALWVVLMPPGPIFVKEEADINKD